MTQFYPVPTLIRVAFILTLLTWSSGAFAQSETEPNNAFNTANPMAFAANMSGGGLCAGDNDDFFRVVLPAGNKSIRLITTANMVSGSGAIYVSLYNKYQQQLDNRYLALSTVNIIDTLDYDCFEGDTFYVRLQNWTGLCKQYTVRCESTNAFTLKNDMEVNDNFLTAVPLAFQTDSTGHLASQRYIGAGPSADGDDHYRCVLPPGGKSIKLVTATRMVTPGATGAVYYYLYNKYQQQLTNQYVTLTSTMRNDTIDFDCFEGDTFYVRIQNWSGPCKEYRVKVDYTNNFSLQNDAEPNDNFTTAQILTFQKDTTGHLASQRYAGGPLGDGDDYYRCILPPGGTKSLRLTTASRMVTPGATGAVYYYLYNKYQQQLTNVYVPFGNTLIIDTLNYDCFEGDTFYVRVLNWSGPCKEYRIRVDYTNNFTLQNDTEPNDGFTTATNLTFQSDTTGHLGSQRYLASATTDGDDYYRCILPPGGTKSLRLTTLSRMVTPGVSGAVYYYFYNKFQQLLTNMYVPFGNTARIDTLDYNCFEGDTFYVRVLNWSGPCKEYQIKVDYTNNFTLQNDVETNDDFATAQELTFRKDTTGHLASQRYLATASDDNNDFYRCILPPGGKSLRLITESRMVTPGVSGAVYYYFYNKYQQQLTNMYVPFGNTARIDTMDYNCFEGDTFYVRILNWSGPCKEYRIRVDYTDNFTTPNDTEPNETMATATPVVFDQDSSGHLGTQLYTSTAPRTDGEDYYRCIAPANGLGLRLLVSSRMVEPGVTGAQYVYIYNKSGTQIGNRYIPLTGTVRHDTLDFPCFTADTFFVRFHDWSGPCKEYSFRLQNSKTGPVQPAFETTRFGNNFSFINQSKFASRYQWNFGTAGTDTVAYPTRLFPIGTHVVRLTATNACGNKVFSDTLYVDGIEYYTPKNAGSENNLGAFHIRAFGAGLDSNLTLTLKKGGDLYQPSRKRSPSQSEFTGWYDFKNVPPGIYDVEIKLSNNQVYIYPAGFEVYVDSPGFNITTEIYAPNRVRTGRQNWYALRVHNKKGRDANGVQAFIATSRGMATTIKDVLYKRTGKLVIKGDDYNMLTIDREAYAKLYYDGDFDPNRDTIEVDYDKIYSAFDSLVSVDIDSLFGEPFRGTLYPISIPYIKAKGTHTIYFQASTPANGDFKLVSYVRPWTMRQNPVSGETLDNIHEIGMQGAALAEMSPHPALKAVGKSAGYVDIGSQIAFAEFFDWYYGTNVADDAFYGRQGVALTGELAGELVPFGNKADAAVDQAQNARRQIQRNNEHLNFDSDMLLSGIKHPGLRKHMEDRLTFLRDNIARHGDNLTRAQREAAINNLLQWSAKQGIRLTEKEVADLLFPKDMQQKKIQSLNSFDPNAIYGPDGPGPEHYIRREADMNYEVTFENVDTALAPAQIVRVHVALDTSRFDLRRTWLNGVRLAGKLYTFEEDRKEYFRDIDLRPAKNMLVRVNARTDTVTGLLYWEFISLDPLTKNLIADVDSGFLPPNKISPEGEGAVSFITHLKSTIANRDTVSAFASIYFDDNPPILTELWKNRVDEGKPVSVLNSVVQVIDDTVMTLGLSGNDAESGFQAYRLYVKKGDSAWSDHPYPLALLSGAVLIGKPGETYSFYVEGRDSVGIWESKQRSTEATVTLKRTVIPGAGEGLVIFPNPARTEVNVTLTTAVSGPIQIIIIDIGGKKVQEATVNHTAGSAVYKLPLTALGSGVYFIEAVINDERLEAKKLVIIR